MERSTVVFMADCTMQLGFKAPWLSVAPVVVEKGGVEGIALARTRTIIVRRQCLGVAVERLLRRANLLGCTAISE